MPGLLDDDRRRDAACEPRDVGRRLALEDGAPRPDRRRRGRARRGQVDSRGPGHARRDGAAREVLVRAPPQQQRGWRPGLDAGQLAQPPDRPRRVRPQGELVRREGRPVHRVRAERVDEQLRPPGAVVGPDPRRAGVEQSRQLERAVDRQPRARDGRPRLVERGTGKARRHRREHRAAPRVRGDQRPVRVQGRRSRVPGVGDRRRPAKLVHDDQRTARVEALGGGGCDARHRGDRCAGRRSRMPRSRSLRPRRSRASLRGIRPRRVAGISGRWAAARPPTTPPGTRRPPPAP